jgi:hypothetical protein
MTTAIKTSQIDDLGILLAQIADLTKQADKIKADIKEEASLSGQKAFDGELFTASYIESNRSTVDWKAIAKTLAIPADLIAKHTGTTAVYSVKVTSR